MERRTWNVRSRERGGNNHTNELLEHIAWARERVRVSHVFVTGISNGCAMAHRFAFEAPSHIDAMACFAHAASPFVGPGPRPVPTLTVTGALDVEHASNAQMARTMATWRATNHCPDALAVAVDASQDEYNVTDWLGCAAPLRHTRFRAPYGHGIVDRVLPAELSVAQMAREFWVSSTSSSP